MAATALALVVVSAPGQAGAKGKHKHRDKRRGSRLIASDTGANLDPNPFWGRNYCANDRRVQQFTTGGDPHPTATGAPQGDSAFRRLTVIDGDNVFGERCELGWDDRRSPTAFYRPGKHRITQASVRLPSGFPLGVDTWQTVIQMKQSGPANNSGGTPVLEVDARGGRWRLFQSVSRDDAGDSRQLWSAPAATGVWTRFSFNVRYSTSKKKGFISLGIDLNGDGDFSDPGERSPGFHTYTLKRETAPGGYGLRPGQAIPSHLRAGIYHNSSIACPPPAGCSVDLDNVQVLRP